MGFFSRFSPLRAIRDLRFFLAQRQPYELGFLVLAMAVTGFFLYAFGRDDYVQPDYKPNITYFEQWPASRTDAEIRAQQKIDEPIKARRLAEERRLQRERQESFKRVDKKLESWGL